MSLEGEALLRAILVDPADDAPRLVYADWLEENGESGRAALIRAIVGGFATRAYAQPKGLGYTDELAPFITPAVRAWASALPAAFGASRCDLWHGLVGPVEMPTAAFMADGTAARLLAAHPVTSVHLTDRQPWTRGDQSGWFAVDPDAPPRAP